MELHRSQMITLARGRFGSPASRVLEQVRAQGSCTRDELARAAEVSTPTLNRTVAALTAAGLLRERPDRAASGAVGRPSVPVEIDPGRFVVVGIHLGRRVATVALADVAGRVVAHRSLPRRPEDEVDLAGLAQVAADLLGARPGAQPLAAGLVAPWRDLELDAAETGARLHDELGLEVATADHIAAVAATEFLHRRSGTPGVTLYVYARNTLGYAIAVDKGFQTEVSRVGSLTHFPAGSDAVCGCGHRGCLEATAGDHAVVARAQAADLPVWTDRGPRGARGQRGIEAVYAAAAAGDPRAHGLLVERARTLGRTAAVVRDMVEPHRVVLVGQAFTGYAPVLTETLSAFKDATALGYATVEFTRFGTGIQAISACTIGLGPVYDDPLAAVPGRRPWHPSPARPAGRHRRGARLTGWYAAAAGAGTVAP